MIRFSILFFIVYFAIDIGTGTSTDDKVDEGNPRDFLVDLPAILITRANSEPLFIDARPPAAYKRLHIEGAINIEPGGLKQANDETIDKLSKASSIFIYCGEGNCTSRTKLLDEYRNAGYRNSAFYPGGVREWFACKLPTAGVAPTREVGNK